MIDFLFVEITLPLSLKMSLNELKKIVKGDLFHYVQVNIKFIHQQ